GSHKAQQQAVFDLFFRKIPYDGGFCIAAGLEQAMEYILNLNFSDEALRWLKGRGFSAEALDYLRDFRFTGDVYAIPEGTLVFPHEPLLRVSAPLPEAQLLESTLLNIVNFQTLIATKAARVCLAAQGGTVLEFGLRRAQGPNGALSASRAAFIGGCNATSNTLAGLRYGIPVSGTMAHSWVMSFPSELEAFRAYAEMYPDHCILLVDTYDTLASGVLNAITVGQELEQKGHRFLGIRLDSGDLAFLSKQARRMLDDAGLRHAQIAASNELDEWIIHDLLAQGARIDVWGVGTSLVVARGASALGGVYKLVAAQDGQEMRPRIKVSGNPEKITDPGVKQVWRVWDANGIMLGDVLALEHEHFKAGDNIASRHGTWFHQRVNFQSAARVEPLLVPVIVNGRPVYRSPSLHEIQDHALQSLSQLRDEHKRVVNAHIYWVGLTEPLFELRTRLLSAASVTTV
ncbi:MAG: nicotinate phosphoribosyltransferase, partial [Candidatus Xenobia bacterium]